MTNNMKKYFVSLLLIGSLLCLTLAMSSCARKSGCPAYEEAVSKPKKGGKFTKGKSQLFDKKMRKQMAGH
ncbi:MAG: hypothetical protein M9911_06170 [Saprospiraceae bacterium]|jgi:hypothetical protein|nr:hypothetical protein [Saprospiraceae bacterium]